ncbi:MAG: carbohydrate ABC transporter permease, partial [Eubacteriales bacterium]
FLFSFTWQWTDTTYNSMLMPDMTILSNTIVNVTKGVTDLAQQGALIDTATLIVIAPLLLVFLFAQRYFIQGIERSGLVE